MERAGTGQHRTTRGGAAKPHSMVYGPTIYQMEPQGYRHHRVE
jgi:hypothetical protein